MPTEPARAGRHRIRRRPRPGLAGLSATSRPGRGQPWTPRRRILAAVGGVVVLAAVVGFVGTVRPHHSPSAGGGLPARTTAASTPASSSTTPTATGSATPLRAPAAPTLQVPVDPTAAAPVPAAPARVLIPSIGVDSALEPLGLLTDGTLQPPTRFQVAGYFSKGPRPGAVGPAVIVGHVDSVSGPAIFFRLRDLAPGAHVIVTTKADRRLDFVVTGAQHYSKARFPTEAVYGPTALPELRLVTCFGRFDFVHRSYLDNLVVSAVLAGDRLG